MNVARKQIVFLLFVAVATMLLSAMNAFAGPGRTTYQAKIIKPDGYPLEAVSVNFKFTILDPAGACILYSETYSSVNMSATGGLISFSLGSGVKTYPVSSPTFEDVFSNITPTLSCDAGGPPSYAPSAADIRKIVMQFHDGGGWQTLPAMNINAVPYAMYANNAQKLNGKTDADFVEVSSVPTCAASEAIRYNGTAFSCIAVGGAGLVTSGSVITALGYTPVNGASLTAVSSDVAIVSAYAANVSSTVFSVSSTVSSLANSISSLQNSVGASFASITSSQWVTSGSAIRYTSGNVGIGTTDPQNILHVSGTARFSSESAGAAIAMYSGNVGAIEGQLVFRTSRTTLSSPSALQNNDVIGSIFAAPYNGSAYAHNAQISFVTDTASQATGVIVKTGAGGIRVERFRIGSNGYIGIGTSAPVTTLDVSGGVKIGQEGAACTVALAGTLRYSSGNVEFCNGTLWSAFGVSGAGITSINGSSSGTQTFAAGIAGAAFNITSNNGVHSFNIPLAASSSVVAGLLSNTDYVTFTNKMNATSAALVSTLGYTPANSNTVFTLSSNLNSVSAAVATAQTNINSVSASVTSLATNTAASLAAIASSQWSTSGTTINYTAGSVGIGTSAPTAALAVSGTTEFIAAQIALPAPGSNGIVNGQVRSLDISPNVNYTTGLGGYQFVHGEKSTIVISSATTATDLTRLYLFGQQHSTTYAATAPTTQLIGSNYLTQVASAGAITALGRALTASFRMSNSNAANGEIQGISGLVSIQGAGGSTGTATEVTGVNALVTATGGNSANTFTVANAYGVRSSVGVSSNASSTLTNAYGVYVYDGVSGGSDGGTLVNQYGLYIENQSLGLNSKYNIYSAGNSSKNYFEGSVIHGAGTSTQAPIKLTSGTLLTAPQSGTIEYDGTSFYLTDGTNTRRAIVTDTGGNYYNVSNISSPGNIVLAPTGSVVVSGGLNVTGNINTSGSIVTTASLTAPTIYGGSLPSGNLTIDSTSHATKGNILMAPSGGRVGIGTSSPTGVLHVVVNNASTAMATVSDAFVLQNKNVTSGALTSMMFSNQDNFATGQIAALQNSGNFGSKMILATKTGGGGAWNNSHLVLDTNGNVGIGNATPAGRLEITPPNDTSTALYIGESNVANSTGLYFSRWGSASSPMGIQGTQAGVGAYPLVLQAQAGNVGIGTITPDEKLTISGGKLAIINTARWDHAAIYHDGQVAKFDAGGAENGLAFRLDGANTDYSATSYTEVMRLMPSGRVGIGTTNPGTRFQIATPASGSVNARFVSGNSNSDLMDVTGMSGDSYLDHLVGARYTVTSTTTLNRAVTFKIDGPPNIAAAASSTLTVNNLFAFWVAAGNSVFGGNVGIGTASAPSSYGHGGTNQFIEIQNPGTTIHSQSHLILTTGVSDIGGTSIGSLTWAQPNVSTPRKEVAWIGAISESASGAAPAAYFQVNTRSASDALPLERLRVSGAGDVGIGTTNPQALLNVYKNLGGAGNGVTIMRVEGQVSGDTNYSLLDLYHGSSNRFHVGGSGKVGIGVSDPATALSNIAAGAIHANVGDQNGTGENSNSLTWATNAAGYSAAIVNTSLSAGANGLNIRTLGTSTNQVILAAGTGVSSTANTSDIFIVRANGNVGVGTATPQARLHTLANGGSLNLEGVDHTYMQYFPDGYAAGRKAWLGFGSSVTSNISMVNEISGGHIELNTAGAGRVGINNPNPATLFHVGTSAIPTLTAVASFTNADGTCTLTPAAAGSGIACSSDERLKDNFIDIGGIQALEKILQFQSVSYNFKTAAKTTRHTGYRAQEVQKILPELVRKDQNGFFQVYYDGLIPWITEAIKAVYVKVLWVEAKQLAQAREIANVKAENAEIKAENEKLKERLDRLEKALNDKK